MNFLGFALPVLSPHSAGMGGVSEQLCGGSAVGWGQLTKVFNVFAAGIGHFDVKNHGPIPKSAQKESKKKTNSNVCSVYCL